MKVYIVVEFDKDNNPVLLDVFRKKDDADKLAYQDNKAWRNVIEKEVK